MDAEQWERAKTLFHQAVDLMEADRHAFLDEACQGDEALKQVVLNLIRADGESGTAVVDEPAWVSDSDDEGEFNPGDRVGAYEIVEEIGRGGMGVVYKARRKDEHLEKTVALKIIKPTFAQPRDLSRFRAERQILANLEHAHIARLYDGGQTEMRVPYFVMEYVDGQPMDRYCQQHGLTLRTRLKLFLQVCEAVQFAHRHMIVHRDLKPSNLLVTRDGQVKLLDFGIAKIMDPDAFQQSLLATRAEQRLLTPAYASPEQLKGEIVSVATDVYALGVILYELLSGQPPYRITSRSLDQVERVICDTDPPKPSSVVGRTHSETRAREASSRDSGEEKSTPMARRLSRQLRGDLDNIVFMAMRKEPENRYGSVDQFAEDIRRFLEGRPVLARTPTWSYRASKFIRRNRLAVSLATMFFIMLCLGLAGTSVGLMEARKARDVAEQENRKALRTIALLQEFLSSADPEKQGKDVKVIDLLEGSFAQVSNLPEDPEIKATMLFTFGKTLHALGQYDRAEEMLEQCVDLRSRALGAHHVETLQARNTLGVVLLSDRQYAEAQTLLEDLWEANRQGDSLDEKQKRSLLGNLGQAALGLGEFEKAKSRFSELLDTRMAQEGPDHPDTLNTMNDLALSYLYSGQGDQAETMLRDTVERRIRVSGEEHPKTLNAMDNLVRVLEQTGKYQEAFELVTRILNIKQKVLGEDHPHTLQTMENRAMITARMGRFEEAETMQRDVLQRRIRVLGEDHPDAVMAKGVLAAILERLNRLEEFVTLQRQVWQWFDAHQGAEHPQTLVALNNLAVGLHRTEKLEEAAKMFERVVKIRAGMLGEEHPQTLNAKANLAMVLVDMEQYDEAESLLNDVYDSSRETLGEEHPDTLLTLYSWALVASKMGNTQVAEARFRQVLRGQSKALGEEHPDTVMTMARLARAMMANGNKEEGDALLQKAKALRDAGK